jgi:parallel beta-helix repeat protein
MTHIRSLPINISNNGELTFYNGVYPGTGTVTDPYRIIGFEFSNPAIELTIGSVNAYVVVSHNLFQNSMIGMYIKDSRNIIIENNTFSNNHLAILLQNSQIPSLYNNSFNNNAVMLIGILSSVNLKNNIQTSNVISYVFLLSSFSGISVLQLFTPFSILFLVIITLIVFALVFARRNKNGRYGRKL